MSVEAEEVLDILKVAEVLGGWKLLNWLSFEFHEGMTVEDIVETVNYAEAIFREELWDGFNRQHGVFTHLRDRIEKRKKEGEKKDEPRT